MLDSPVHATDEDGNVRSRDGPHKLAKLGIVPQRERLPRRLSGADEPNRSTPVVGAHEAKQGEDNDLESDACDDGLVPRALELAVLVARGGGDAAADGLDDEAGQVGGEKDARVPGGRDAGEVRREVQGDVLESEVDGDADEGRGENDGANLQLEGAVIPGVVVEEDAADVACCTSVEFNQHLLSCLLSFHGRSQCNPFSAATSKRAQARRHEIKRKALAGRQELEDATHLPSRG